MGVGQEKSYLELVGTVEESRGGGAPAERLRRSQGGRKRLFQKEAVTGCGRPC